MNNEIKEILEYLKDKNDYIEDFGIAYKRIHIDNGDLKILLDYITNLQQEIEKLNDDKRGMLVQLYKANDEKDKIKQENERLKELVDADNESYDIQETIINRQKSELLEQEDYKSRCEKAIEYINTHYLNANEPELLNILQNGSDDNE